MPWWVRFRWLSVALLVLLSMGWLAPLWLGIDTVLTYLDVEVGPRLHGRPTTNSFPHVAFARDCFQVAIAWLTLVALGWASLGASRLLRPTTGHAE